MQFQIKVNAPKEEVWGTLWKDKTFREWSNIIDEGTYMVGEMKEGNNVQFISSVSGYGVTSFIEKMSPNEFVSFKHMTDTKTKGKQEREKEWTGSAETYSLTESKGVTTLTIKIDVPLEQEETFKIIFPKALKRIKTLAENNKDEATKRTDIAKGFFKAFASGDREFIEEHMAENFVFSSPPDPHLDKAGYFERCWPFAGRGWEFHFVRVIESGETVVVTYEQKRTDGTLGRNTEVFTFSGEKVQRIEVYFG